VTHQPSVIVELAQGDTDCLLAAGDTIEGLARGATYTAVTKQSESESLAALASSSPIELLHLSLLESSDGPLPHLEGWFELMSPGAIVVTSGASTEGSHFMRTKQMVSDRFPSISVGFGSLAEALVAQAPIDGSTPVIELLRDYRPGTRDLAVVELDAADLVTDESPSELAVKNFVAAVRSRLPHPNGCLPISETRRGTNASISSQSSSIESTSCRPRYRRRPRATRPSWPTRTEPSKSSNESCCPTRAGPPTRRASLRTCTSPARGG
jgi:hypothetical protein